MNAFRRVIAAVIIAACTAAPTYAQSTNKLLAPFQAVVEKVNASTVRILCNDKDAALGAIVAADGLILTKASELRGTITVKLGDGSKVEAKILATNKPTDLALLKIPVRGLKTVAFADTKKEPIGNWLAAAGTGRHPIAVGIISVMTRNLTGFDATDTLNQNRGFLGIILDPTDDPSGGAKIERFPTEERGGTGSAAKKAGLKVGDIIFEVNGKAIDGSQMLREMLENYKPGEKVHVKVRRKTEEKNYTITLGRATPTRSDIQNAMGGELSGRRTGFPTVLQTDMILDPQNCGGPVVDLDGKVLGISIARAGRVETWILPSETIRPILADMISGKSAVKAVPVKKKLNPVAPPPRTKK